MHKSSHVCGVDGKGSTFSASPPCLDIPYLTIVKANRPMSRVVYIEDDVQVCTVYFFGYVCDCK